MLGLASSFYAGHAQNPVVMYEMLQSAQDGRRLRELVVFGLNPESDCNWVGKKLCFYKAYQGR